METALHILRTAGLRATDARVVIFSLIDSAQQPLSMADLTKKVRARGIDGVTVYRTVAALREAGLIRSVDLGHGHQHVESTRRHHHHLVCDNCGRIEDVTVPGESRVVAAVSKLRRWSLRDHAMEFFGRCPSCQTT